MIPYPDDVILAGGASAEQVAGKVAATCGVQDKQVVRGRFRQDLTLSELPSPEHGLGSSEFMSNFTLELRHGIIALKMSLSPSRGIAPPLRVASRRSVLLIAIVWEESGTPRLEISFRAPSTPPAHIELRRYPTRLG